MPGMPPDQPKGQLAIMPHIVPFLGVRPARAGSDHWWYGLLSPGIWLVELASAVITVSDWRGAGLDCG